MVTGSNVSPFRLVLTVAASPAPALLAAGEPVAARLFQQLVVALQQLGDFVQFLLPAHPLIAVPAVSRVELEGALL